MVYPVFGLFDFRLYILALLVGIVAAYTALDLLDRAASSLGYRRFGWVVVGGFCLGLGTWSMQCVAALATQTVTVLSYDLRVLSLALLFGAALAILGYARYAQGGRRLRAIIGTGSLLGLAITVTHLTGLAAIRTNPPTHYDPVVASLSVVVTFATTILAVMLGAHSGERRRGDGLRRRLLGAVLLGTGICQLYLAGIQSMTLEQPQALAPVTAANSALAVALALATLCITISFLVGSALDAHLRNANEQTLEFVGLYYRERNVTHTLQRALLPTQLPKIDGTIFSSAYLPHSEESKVGGDWYDAFVLADGRIAIAMGDVAGHGLRAALTMNVVRHAIRSAALEDASPGSVLARANRVLHASEYPAIVTAAFAVLHPATLELTYAGAGHPPTLVCGPDHDVNELALSDPPLGVIDDLIMTDHRTVLAGGSMIVMYTDGCTESSRDLIIGERRLRAALPLVRQLGDRAAETLADRIFRSSPRQDDAAIMCIAVNESVEQLHVTLPALPDQAAPARNALRRYLQGLPLGSERRNEMILVVGEAISAAIDHADPSGVGYFTLSARAIDDGVEIDIRDYGRRRSDDVFRQGLGGPLMRRLADNLTIHSDDDGTLVTAQILLSPSAALQRAARSV